MKIKHWILLGLLAAPAAVMGTSCASAQTYLPGAEFSVACENGGNYRLNSGRAAFPGDIVTGHLHLGPRHAVSVRLIPMGEGYRYAGHGVWLDGIRDHALLYRSKYRPVACVVSRI
jgi:hypothetical protein